MTTNHASTFPPLTHALSHTHTLHSDPSFPQVSSKESCFLCTDKNRRPVTPSGHFGALQLPVARLASLEVTFNEHFSTGASLYQTIF